MRETWVGAVIAVALVVGLVAGFALGINVEARQRLFIGPPPEAVEETAAPGVPYKCTLGEWQVQPGETLWDIARRCYPGEHTGRVVDAIQRANPGLDAGRLHVGQRLVLPERGQ